MHNSLQKQLAVMLLMLLWALGPGLLAHTSPHCADEAGSDDPCCCVQVEKLHCGCESPSEPAPSRVPADSNSGCGCMLELPSIPMELAVTSQSVNDTQFPAPRERVVNTKLPLWQSFGVEHVPDSRCLPPNGFTDFRITGVMRI